MIHRILFVVVSLLLSGCMNAEESLTEGMTPHDLGWAGDLVLISKGEKRRDIYLLKHRGPGVYDLQRGDKPAVPIKVFAATNNASVLLAEIHFGSDDENKSGKPYIYFFFDKNTFHVNAFKADAVAFDAAQGRENIGAKMPMGSVLQYMGENIIQLTSRKDLATALDVLVDNWPPKLDRSYRVYDMTQRTEVLKMQEAAKEIIGRK